MKILKRVLCLTLAVLMLLPLLVACKKNNEGEAQSGVDSSLLAAEMPDDGIGFQDYGGREIRILGWTAASANEFEVAAEDTGTTLKAAVFARNEALKGRLNVNLKWDYIEGHSSYEPAFVTEAGNRASQGKIDLITPYSQAGSLLMINGTIRDLKNVPNLRLSDPWWTQSFEELCSVNGKLYFTSGDISWTLLGNTFTFFFNKDILSKKSAVLDPFGVNSMYELVDTKQWTIPNMITIAKAVQAKDVYGFTAYLVAMDAFYTGCGFNYYEIDVNTGAQKIAPDMGAGVANEVLRQLTEFFRTEASAAIISYSTELDYATNNGNTSNPIMPEWRSGQSLFNLQPVLSITDFKFSEFGFDFGVLPMPMRDASQGQYLTVPDFEFSICAIPRQISNEDLPIMGAVLQVLASEGHTRIIPKYYDQVLKKQEADSSSDYAMMDTIRASIKMEAARMFGELYSRNGAIWGVFRNAVRTQRSTLSDSWDAGSQAYINTVENMAIDMRNLEARYGNS